jgi:hypothetical protein
MPVFDYKFTVRLMQFASFIQGPVAISIQSQGGNGLHLRLSFLIFRDFTLDASAVQQLPYSGVAFQRNTLRAFSSRTKTSSPLTATCAQVSSSPIFR